MYFNRDYLDLNINSSNKQYKVNNKKLIDDIINWYDKNNSDIVAGNFKTNLKGNISYNDVMTMICYKLSIDEAKKYSGSYENVDKSLKKLTKLYGEIPTGPIFRGLTKAQYDKILATTYTTLRYTSSFSTDKGQAYRFIDRDGKILTVKNCKIPLFFIDEFIRAIMFVSAACSNEKMLTIEECKTKQYEMTKLKYNVEDDVIGPAFANSTIECECVILSNTKLIEVDKTNLIYNI